jgi:hypothetical protein
VLFAGLAVQEDRSRQEQQLNPGACCLMFKGIGLTLR